MGEEKHFAFICTGLTNTQSAVAHPAGAHVVSVPAGTPGSHLQDNGELLRGVAVLHAHGQPDLECRQLLRKEGAVLLEQGQECGLELKPK